MKKLIVLCVGAIVATCSLFAQDIIVTKDAKKIEATILEVSKSEIKYKEIDNPNGPTFILETDEISSIIYSNGKVVVYNQNAQDTAKEPEKEEPVVNNDDATSQETNGRIFRENGDYYYKGSFISAKEVERILERENTAAYNQWKKAHGMLVGGAVCTGIGSGLVLGGLVSLISDPIVCIAIECSALVPLGIGLGLTLGSSSGYNKAIDIYNSKYDHAAVQLKWHVAPTEVGLAIAF